MSGRNLVSLHNDKDDDGGNGGVGSRGDNDGDIFIDECDFRYDISLLFEKVTDDASEDDMYDIIVIMLTTITKTLLRPLIITLVILLMMMRIQLLYFVNKMDASEYCCYGKLQAR